MIRGQILSNTPRIFLTETYSGSPFLGDAESIAKITKGSESTIFIVPAATLQGKGTSAANAVKSFRALYPKIRLIILANEIMDINEAKIAGVEAEQINQNAFLDERIFQIIENEKKFDAVYNGQMLPFKRHYLAKKINSIALIYYGNDESYFLKVKDEIPHAHFINGEPKPNPSSNGNLFRFLAPADIIQVYASSFAGLCLSSREGAMYASGEYLLCGLPIVTTQNIGGRNEFFDDENSIFVDDDPASVAEAVEKIKEQRFDRKIIRERFIQKSAEIRRRFFQIVDGIRRDNGIKNSDFESEFMDNLFHDKVWKKRTPVEVFLQL